jgi:hypothetical protein
MKNGAGRTPAPPRGSARRRERVAGWESHSWRHGSSPGGSLPLVYSAGPLRDALLSEPWLIGPGPWLVTALGSGTLLRSLPERDYPRPTLALATIAGAQMLVVAAGHPWPGLVVGVGVFAATAALLDGSSLGQGPHRATGDRGRPAGQAITPARPIKHKVVLQIAADVLWWRWQRVPRS